MHVGEHHTSVSVSEGTQDGIAELVLANERHERRKAQNRKAQRKFRSKKVSSSVCTNGETEDDALDEGGSGSSSSASISVSGNDKSDESIRIGHQSIDVDDSLRLLPSADWGISVAEASLSPAGLLCQDQPPTVVRLDNNQRLVSTYDTDLFNFRSSVPEIDSSRIASQLEATAEGVAMSLSPHCAPAYVDDRMSGLSTSAHQEITEALGLGFSYTDTQSSLSGRMNSRSGTRMDSGSPSGSNAPPASSSPRSSGVSNITGLSRPIRGTRECKYVNWSSQESPPPGSLHPPKCQDQIRHSSSLSASPGLPHAPPEPDQQLDWHLPLHIAVEKGHESIVKTLIDCGVNINERDSEGCTALHVAVRVRQEGVLKALLHHGAEVNPLDGNGWTPVHTAAENGFAAGLWLLLEYGGNLSIKAQKKQR